MWDWWHEWVTLLFFTFHMYMTNFVMFKLLWLQSKWPTSTEGTSSPTSPLPTRLLTSPVTNIAKRAKTWPGIWNLSGLFSNSSGAESTVSSKSAESSQKFWKFQKCWKHRKCWKQWCRTQGGPPPNNLPGGTMHCLGPPIFTTKPGPHPFWGGIVQALPRLPPPPQAMLSCLTSVKHLTIAVFSENFIFFLYQCHNCWLFLEYPKDQSWAHSLCTLYQWYWWQF